jgi:hypothetical protein
MDKYTSSEYLAPETIWESFGITSYEQFLEKFW